MNPPTLRTAVCGLFAVMVAVAMPFQGVSASTPAARFPISFQPTMTTHGPLTKAQIIKLAGGAQQHVIVILKNQFSALSGRARHDLVSRNAAIAAAQRPVISELHVVRASHVLGFRIINAIRATVSSAEAAHLRGEPDIRAVVPDATIPVPNLALPDGLLDRLRTAAKTHASLPKCTSTKATPSLQPEALALTHTAYQNRRTPQAQGIVNGRGVTVAIVSGPIAPYNPDFIRPNGSPVISDFENFGGDPNFTPGGGGGWDIESFLDMSSIAAQGNEIFNLNDWTNNLGGKCSTIRILGMAPGASIMWLDIAGQHGETNSTFLQAIQYAVANGANVISESFGSNPNNDTGIDPDSLANAAAAAAGVTVVASSGDSGSNNSLGSPGDINQVIEAGATTSFQYRQLIGSLKEQHNSGYLDNNVVAFSSSGITQLGNKTVDVVAPGAFGFVDCTPNPTLFPGCDNPVTHMPLPFAIVGGTSESAPLTAGEAALVVEAYASTHGDYAPPPSLVKRIIMSTSTDLGDPTSEQGAGLINSYKAVRSAESWGQSAKTGTALVTSPTDVTARGMPGTRQSLSFSVTNDGTGSETVTPRARTVGLPTVVKSTTVNVKASSFTQTQCAIEYAYPSYHYCPPEATIKFKIPAGTGRFDVNIAWNVVKQPYGEIELKLISPKGRYAGNTEPNDNGPPLTSSGYGHVDIARPAAGTWQAQVALLGYNSTTPLYNGPVTVNITKSNFVRFGTISPASAKLGSGQSRTFTLKTKLPAHAGDTNADILVVGKGASGKPTDAGAIPVILRTLIPISHDKGSFSGTFMGGNGRGPALWSHAYDFSVPSGTSTLAVNLRVPDKHDNLQGVLVDPEGYAINVESTVTSFNTNPYSQAFGLPTAYTNTMQFFQVRPPAGLWQFVLEVNDNLSGSMVSTPFTGSVVLNQHDAKESGLPDDTNITLAAGKTETATLKITNNGNTTKSFFVDPRQPNNQVLFALSTQVHMPLNRAPFDAAPTFLVPPESQAMEMGAESVGTSSTPTVPIMFDTFNVAGAPPFGNGGDPDLVSSPSFNAATSDFTAGLTFGSNYEMPMGLWEVAPTQIGPYANGANKGYADVGTLLQTANFDSAVGSSTGDLWKVILFGTSRYSPLTLAPGQSGTIRIMIRPDQPSGTAVHGVLYVDTFPAPSGFPFKNNTFPFTISGDEMAAVPYSYTVK